MANWIKKAIKHPGALRAKAKAAGLVRGDAPLSETAIGKLKNSKNATTRKQANLAQTLKGMNK